MLLQFKIHLFGTIEIKINFHPKNAPSPSLAYYFIACNGNEDIFS